MAVNAMRPTTADRPVLRVPRSALDLVLDAVAFAGLVVCIVIAVSSWGELPEKIPHHFGFSGRPDSWGGKWVLAFLSAVSLVMYVGATILSRYPHRFNYWWAINEHNAARQYRVAVSMMGWLKVEVVWLFTFITWTTVRTGLGKSEGFGAWSLPLIIVVVLMTVAVHLVLAYRRR